MATRRKTPTDPLGAAFTWVNARDPRTPSRVNSSVDQGLSYAGGCCSACKVRMPAWDRYRWKVADQLARSVWL